MSAPPHTPRPSFWSILREETRHALSDADGWGVLIANAVTLALALYLHWSLTALLWPYWAQSVLVGIATVWRLGSLRDVSRAGLKLGAAPMQPGAVRVMAWLFAAFFVFHFGLAHVVYLIFVYALAAREGAQGVTAGWVLLSALVFAGSQFIITRHQIARDRVEPPALPSLMALPYVRVLPMHLTIIVGAALGGGAAAIVLFGALKTLAELMGLRLEKRLTGILKSRGDARGTACVPDTAP